MQTQSGTFAVVGTTVRSWSEDPRSPLPQAFVVGLDASGHETWSYLLNQGVTSSAQSIALSKDGGLVVTGSLRPAEGSSDCYVLKLRAPEGGK